MLVQYSKGLCDFTLLWFLFAVLLVNWMPKLFFHFRKSLFLLEKMDTWNLQKVLLIFLVLYGACASSREITIKLDKNRILCWPFFLIGCYLPVHGEQWLLYLLLIKSPSTILIFALLYLAITIIL